MRIAIGNMWTTIQWYSRASSNAIYKEHSTNLPNALIDAALFGPAIVYAIKHSPDTLQEASSRFFQLAYAKDCLNAIIKPVYEYYQLNGKPWDLDMTPLMPVLKPIAEHYANAYPSYKDFRSFKKSEFSDLFYQFIKDDDLFGSNHKHSLYSGLKICCYTSIINKDTTSFSSFSKNIILALFDKAAKITGTSTEIKTSRDEICSVIGQLEVHMNNALGIKAPQASVSLPQQSHTTNADVPKYEMNQNPTLLAEAKAELEQMIGLDGVKEDVRKLMNFLKIQQERQRHGLKESIQTLHFVFTGNPGTGKTTVSRILGKIFHGFGILTTNKIVECDRSSLVGGYLGQTAIKTDELIHSALDGVLFIDEAYTLSSNSDNATGDSYGTEAINTLLKRMEDYRDRLIVIVAGYPNLMNQFIKSNPGLESRFTRYIHFQDYSVTDMCRIFNHFCQAGEYILTPMACAKAYLLFTVAYQNRDERFGNARFVRNIFERSISLQSNRLAGITGKLDKKSLMSIDDCDIPSEGGDVISQNQLTMCQWRAMCPGCQKIHTCSTRFLNQRVTCKCGKTFIFPWPDLEDEETDG